MTKGSNQAFWILRVLFTIVPIVAGLDKYARVLTQWDKYVSPAMTHITRMQARSFMSLVGVIEIVAGILVAVKPAIGAYVVFAWLVGIALNLLLLGGVADIAVRDLGLAVSALALAFLSNDAAQTQQKPAM